MTFQSLEYLIFLPVVFLLYWTLCRVSKIFFGELTFYDGSGYMKFSPDSFDFEMGEKFEINFSKLKV